MLDYLIVTHGQLTLTLHDDTTKIVKAGDLVVQTAAVHQWSNETSEPARECQPAYFPALQGWGSATLSISLSTSETGLKANWVAGTFNVGLPSKARKVNGRTLAKAFGARHGAL